MNLRESITKTLDLLISESSKNIDEKTKKSKLKAWHIGLNDITDDQIRVGLVKALKSTKPVYMHISSWNNPRKPLNFKHFTLIAYW